jgi:hypothetical protein
LTLTPSLVEAAKVEAAKVTTSDQSSTVPLSVAGDLYGLDLLARADWKASQRRGEWFTVLYANL